MPPPPPHFFLLIPVVCCQPWLTGTSQHLKDNMTVQTFLTIPNSSVICVLQASRKKSHYKNTKNTKHDPNYCSPNKKIGKGMFGFAFDVRHGKEKEAEALRLEWSQQNKDKNNMTEKEKNVEDKTNEPDDNESSENEEKCKESEMVDLEDYYQIEFVNGEPIFVCNICNEGLDAEAEITKHIKDKKESIMSDDLNDSDLYEGFDEDGNRIVENDNM